MDKNMQPDLQAALEKATVSRKAFVEKHPKFLGKEQPEKRFEITPQMRREAKINALRDGESVN